jgi:hypothetical protein
MPVGSRWDGRLLFLLAASFAFEHHREKMRVYCNAFNYIITVQKRNLRKFDPSISQQRLFLIFAVNKNEDLHGLSLDGFCWLAFRPSTVSDMKRKVRISPPASILHGYQGPHVLSPEGYRVVELSSRKNPSLNPGKESYVGQRSCPLHQLNFTTRIAGSLSRHKVQVPVFRVKSLPSNSTLMDRTALSKIRVS